MLRQASAPAAFFCLVLLGCLSSASLDTYYLSKEHRTQAAVEKVSDLYCYQCDTMDHGDTCIQLPRNETWLEQKCRSDNRVCMVKRISYSITNDSNVTYTLWSVNRNCSKGCEPGCIVIGERTKLYACTACCNTSYCNTGTVGVYTEGVGSLEPVPFLLGALVGVGAVIQAIVAF